jgi:hypothetical protein
MFLVFLVRDYQAPCAIQRHTGQKSFNFFGAILADPIGHPASYGSKKMKIFEERMRQRQIPGTEWVREAKASG